MRVVLVTGAGKRIGRGIAEGLAADGWAVVLHHNRSGEDARALAAEIETAGGRAVALGADLADAAATGTLVPAACAAFGRLDAIVNNASLFEKDTATTLDPALFDAHMAVNARAPAQLTRDLANALPAGRTGCVVNVLDQKLWNMNPDFLSYTISKVALLGFTRAMAMALDPKVRVCGVSPGLTLPSGNQTRERFDEIHDRTPLGRGNTVEDVVQAIRFVLDSPGLNGVTVMADGGQHMESSPFDVLFPPLGAT